MARLLSSEDVRWVEGSGPEAFDAMLDALFWIVESGTHEGQRMYEPISASIECDADGYTCNLIIQGVPGKNQGLFDQDLDTEADEG